MFTTWAITTKSLEGCYESILNDFIFPSAFFKGAQNIYVS